QDFGEDKLNQLVKNIGHIAKDDLDFFNQLKTAFEEWKTKYQHELKWSSIDESINVLDNVTRARNGEDPGRFQKFNSNFSVEFGVLLKEWLKEYCYSQIVGLSEMFSEVELRLSDGCKYVVTSDEQFTSKGQKKFENAIAGYAYGPGQEDTEKKYRNNLGNFLVLFDTTAFGKADAGIFFDTSSVCYRGMMESRKHYYLYEIKTIKVRGDELVINGCSFRFFHSEIKRPLTIVADVVQKYVNQPARKLLMAIDD